MSVSASAVSRVTGVAVEYKNFNAGKASMLSQRLAIVGVGNSGVVYGSEKYECEGSAEAVGARYGYGSPLHLAARQLFPVAGKGASFPVTIYPLQEARDSVAAIGSVGCTGTATDLGSGKIYIGGIVADFAVSKNEKAESVLEKIKNAINSILEMPVVAGDISDGVLALTSKAAGSVGNLIKVMVEGNVPGLVFEAENMANGSGDPDVDLALASFGNVWETAVLNTFDYKNTEMLEKYTVWGKSRWDDLAKKPVIVFSGCTDSYSIRTAITDSRPTDFINSLIVSVGSRELPYVIAAKAMVNDILTTADSNPAVGYKGLLEGLKAGAESVQEDYQTRNNSVMKGSSTNILNGSVAELNDIVTMYHPASEGKFASRRYVVDIMKLMNVVYNVRLIMEADNKKGVPIVGDDEVVSNPYAIQPKTVKGEFATLAYSLNDKAIIRDAKYTIENMEVKEDSENPKRLNVKFPVKLSGNLEVSSTDIYFGFYLGGN